MAYNVPNYDTKRFSFGPGVLYMGAPGTTPLVDIGAVKGNAEFSVERTLLKVEQGSPKSLVQEYVTKEEVKLKVTGIEWNFDNLSYLLGAGATTGIGGVTETFEFGGAMTVNNRALRFVHRTPDGSTIDIHVFAAQGAGKIAIPFNEDNMHEFPFEFQALEGTTDFTGQALAASKKLFKITRTKA
jgi:hypothetical protein